MCMISKRSMTMRRPVLAGRNHPGVTCNRPLLPALWVKKARSSTSLMKTPRPEVGTTPSAPEEDEPADSEFFSLDDVDLRDTTPSSSGAADQLQTGSSPAANSAEPEIAPFSLADLGLTEDEIAGYAHPYATEPTPTTSPAAAASHTAPEPEPAPFSLADLGLSEDEIADFGHAQPQAGTTADAPPELAQAPTAEPEFAPFSLADLGLTEDEINSFDLGGSPLPSAEQIAHVEVPGPETQPTTSSEAVHEPARMAPAGGEVQPVVPASEAAAVQPAHEPAEAAHPPVPVVPMTPEVQPAPEFVEAAPPPVPAAASESPMVPQTPVAAQEHAGATPAAPALQPVSQPMAPPTTSVPTAGPSVTAPAVRPQPVVSRPSVTPSTSGATDLQRYQAQLQADPDNDTLRLAIARMSEQTGALEQALSEYKHLLRRGALVDPVADDLQELLAAHTDPAMLRRLHRLLGDAYMKQDRFNEAMDEYSWTPSRGS